MNSISRRNLGLLPAACLITSLAGCGQTEGVAGSVLLTVRFAADVPAAIVEQTHTLTIDTSGAETFSRSVLVKGQLSPGPATIRYRPGVAAGLLRFKGSAVDVGGVALATGMTAVAILPGGEATGEIVLDVPRMKRDGGVDDAGARDLAMPDLAPALDMTVPRDLAVPDLMPLADLTAFPDLTRFPDLTMFPDLVALPDMTPLPDLTPLPLVPSHVAANSYMPLAGDLPSTAVTIDTSNLLLFDKLKGAVAVPANGAFVADGNNNAVLSIGKWTVTDDVTVVGTRRLVVVAAGDVTLNAVVHASANLFTPGPGGAASNAGPGAGGQNQINGDPQDPGGGGAGFGSAGAKGGDTVKFAGGVAGGAYGPLLTDWNGGSGGGDGSGAGICANNRSQGGGGGGAVQISSNGKLTVGINGGIDVNGGGGRGGCYSVPAKDSTAGGGGGSGGAIFLEAPTVLVSGGLFANGGSGGAGGDDVVKTFGADGNNGLSAILAATGAVGAGTGTSGGDGGFTGPPSPGANSGGNGDAGGGGGAAGRVWLRTRSINAVVAGSISPAPAFDTSL